MKIRKNYLLGEVHSVTQFEKIAEEERDSLPDINLNMVKCGHNYDKGMSQATPLDSPIIPDDWN